MHAGRIAPAKTVADHVQHLVARRERQHLETTDARGDGTPPEVLVGIGPAALPERVPVQIQLVSGRIAITLGVHERQVARRETVARHETGGRAEGTGARRVRGRDEQVDILERPAASLIP